MNNDEGISKKNYSLFEHGVPALLTIIWIVGLFFIVAPFFEQPTLIYSPYPVDHNIIVDIRIALVLFFFEACVCTCDFAYTNKNKKFSSGIFWWCAAILFFLAIYFILESICLWYRHPDWLIYLALICVAPPKLLTCELSGNPKHFIKEFEPLAFTENISPGIPVDRFQPMPNLSDK